MIAEQLANLERSLLSRTSKAMHALIVPILYREVTIAKVSDRTSPIRARQLLSLPLEGTFSLSRLFEYTVDLDITGAKSLLALAVLTSCGRNLRSLTVGFNWYVEDERRRLARALPDPCKLRKFYAEGYIGLASVYAWLVKMPDLEELHLEEIFSAKDEVPNECPRSKLPRGIRSLSIDGIDCESDPLEFLRDLLRRTAPTLETLELSYLGRHQSIFARPSYPDWHGFVKPMPNLHTLSLRDFPDAITLQLLGQAPKLENFTYRTAQNPNRDNGIPIQHHDVINGIPDTIETLEITWLRDTEETARSLVKCIRRLTNLTSLLVMQYFEVESEGSPVNSRALLLQELRNRGLTWSSFDELDFLLADPENP